MLDKPACNAVTAKGGHALETRLKTAHAGLRAATCARQEAIL